MLMVVLEYLPIKKYGILLFLALMVETMGKFLAVWVTDGDLEEEKWAISIVVPSVILYVISALMATESPRYWIDHNLL
jgi:cytochrome c oxidase subunit IV